MPSPWYRNGLYVASAVLCSLYSASAMAHKLAPSLLEIEEVGKGTYEVVWRTPVDTRTFPEPVLPASCVEGPSTAVVVGSAIERRWRADCAGGLQGRAVEVALLAESRTVAMLLFSPAGEAVQRKILTPEAPSYVVPERRSAESVFRDYIRLGIEHILIGADHLLLVLGLLFLAGSFGTLVKTVTAFTLGHSVTLALVSLEVMPNWPSFVELLIAATILMLALELSRASPDERQRYLRTHPWPVASVFGLIHGLGFANVLKDIGMPADDLMAALLSFNIGIEIGQLMFVSAVAILLLAAHQWSARGVRVIRALAVSVMGGVSVFWCLDRGLELAAHVL